MARGSQGFGLERCAVPARREALDSDVHVGYGDGR